MFDILYCRVSSSSSVNSSGLGFGLGVIFSVSSSMYGLLAQ